MRVWCVISVQPNRGVFLGWGEGEADWTHVFHVGGVARILGRSKM